MRALDFFFEFASTYSYPCAMRADIEAAKRGVTLNWRPFLLGPIFAAQNWTTSPFNLYPAKGRYMWREMERLCEAQRLPFAPPDPFPQNSLLAARVATAVEDEHRPQVARLIYRLEFGEGLDISKPETIARALRSAGLDAESYLERAAQQETKDKLRATTDAAIKAGVFGAPSFVAPDGELYWGNDRLEAALDWAAAFRE
ncbi:MAG: 2-hydroxychromene-2-carboxylate isomerase [Hyphomonadaceae bacterium]